MSVSEAVKALTREKKQLLAEVSRIDKAIAVLDPTAAASTIQAKPKPKPKKRKRAAWDGPIEAVTCPLCGFVAKAPQGLSSHLNSHEEDGDDDNATTSQ